MAEPFVFYFKPAHDGRPLLMYIADLSCACGVCKHPQIQRFYHATDFHSFTLTRLDELADEAATKAGYECENCGEMVGVDGVNKTTVTVGFPDETGLLRAFTDLESDTRTYQLVEDRRLDPQELPGFGANEASPIYDALDDALVEERLGRPTNLKVAWRHFLEGFCEHRDEGWTRLGRGIVAYVTEGSLDELVEVSFAEDEGLQADEALEDAYLIDLEESVPDELATHENPEEIVGAYRQWLGASAVESVSTGEFRAGALVSVSTVRAIVERAFEVARLDYDFDAEALVYRAITTPGELQYESDLSVESILHRAVFTGITPGDAARLTAEEIVGVLLRVWHPE